MEEIIKIIWNHPALWFMGFALGIWIYAFVRYWIPLMWHKPKNDIEWITLIASLLIILGLMRMIYLIL